MLLNLGCNVRFLYVLPCNVSDILNTNIFVSRVENIRDFFFFENETESSPI